MQLVHELYWLSLSKVKEDAAHKGKLPYINFKRVIWHEGSQEIIKELSMLSRVGYKVECGDGVIRTLFPFVHIISVDYEEQ